MQNRRVREPALYLVCGEATKICPSLPQVTSSQVENPEQQRGFLGQSSLEHPGEPYENDSFTRGGGVSWKEVSGELAAQPVLGDRGCEKTGNFYSLSRLLPLF